MQHLRWEKTGRVFNHADEAKPNTFTWKSSIGQQNVDKGDGTFAPYVWNIATRTIKFGECELRFTLSGLEFWKGTEKLNILSFNPEWKQGLNWRRRVPSVGSLSVTEIDT